MAMSKEANVLNLVYLTERGGTKLVRALFLQRFTAMKPDNVDLGIWTVDMFLKTNMENIRSLKLNRSSMQILYPTEGTKTNLEFWDLFLFLKVLKTTCHLSTDVRMKLSALKKLRDKLAHIGDSDITDKQYTSRLDKIHIIFETVLKELKDKKLEKTVREMFQKTEGGLIPYTELSTALQKLQMSYEGIKKSEEETRNTIRAEHSETRKKIEKGDTEILNEIKSLGQRIASTHTTISATIPVKLKPLNGTEEVDECLTKALVELFNEEILPTPERHDQSRHTKTLRDAVHKFYIRLRGKGYEIVNAESGCILLHAKFSLIKLFSFYTDFICGKLDIFVDDIERAAKTFLRFEEFRMEMILYEHDFFQVLHEIKNHELGRNLSFGQGYSDDQHKDADRKDLYVQDGGTTSVLLTFKPLSHFDGKEFETVLESESKRLIQKLPKQASISKNMRGEQELTGQESEVSTRDSSTVTSLDEWQLTRSYKDDRHPERINWSKATLALKVAKVSICRYISAKWEAFLLRWTTKELEELPHFFENVDAGRIIYTNKRWKMQTACPICSKIFDNILRLQQNSTSENLKWKPDGVQNKENSGREIIKTNNYPKTCEICLQKQCLFKAEREGFDLQNKDPIDLSTRALLQCHTPDALNNIAEYYWRIGNMFMFYGKETHLIRNTSPADTDTALVFKMMKNCKLFDRQDVNIYDQVLDARHNLMHSPNQRIPEYYFNLYMEAFINFLTEYEVDCTTCFDGIQEIRKLREAKLTVTDEVYISRQAIQIQTEALRYDLTVKGGSGVSHIMIERILKTMQKTGTGAQIGACIGAAIGIVGGPVGVLHGVAIGGTIGGMIGTLFSFR